MTYEEKLQLVLTYLKNERDLTRKGHKTNIRIEGSPFDNIDFLELVKIILKLQDDEKVLTITNAFQDTSYVNPSNDDEYANVDGIILELNDSFDEWYENYLMDQKTNLKNLDWVNFLRIYDVLLDIDAQIQLTQSTNVHINLMSTVIRFQALFPVDTIAMRDEYCDNRLNALKYLKKKNVIIEYTHGQDGWHTIVSVKLVLSRFNDCYNNFQSEYRIRKPIVKQDDNSTTNNSVARNNSISEVAWSSNFTRNGKNFTFGEYGSVSFQSKDRTRMLNLLFDKQGDWVTVSELAGDKDDEYVRSTIRQIVKRFPKESFGHVLIPSTIDDTTSSMPTTGAYRLKIVK